MDAAAAATNPSPNKQTTCLRSERRHHGQCQPQHTKSVHVLGPSHHGCHHQVRAAQHAMLSPTSLNTKGCQYCSAQAGAARLAHPALQLCHEAVMCRATPQPRVTAVSSDQPCTTCTKQQQTKKQGGRIQQWAICALDNRHAFATRHHTPDNQVQTPMPFNNIVNHDPSQAYNFFLFFNGAVPPAANTPRTSCSSRLLHTSAQVVCCTDLTAHQERMGPLCTVPFYMSAPGVLYFANLALFGVLAAAYPSVVRLANSGCQLEYMQLLLLSEELSRLRACTKPHIRLFSSTTCWNVKETITNTSSRAMTRQHRDGQIPDCKQLTRTAARPISICGRHQVVM